MGHAVRLMAPQCDRPHYPTGANAHTACALVALLGDAKNFKDGRPVAAWLGLVPRQHSSGGQTKPARHQQTGRDVSAHLADPRSALGDVSPITPRTKARPSPCGPWLRHAPCRASRCNPGASSISMIQWTSAASPCGEMAKTPAFLRWGCVNLSSRHGLLPDLGLSNVHAPLTSGSSRSQNPSMLL